MSETAIIVQYGFLALLALLFGFGLRMPFSMSSNSDQWGVFTKIKKHVGKKWLDYSMPDAVPNGVFPYPMLTHYLVSRFPERYWKIVSYALNQSADIATAIILYAAIIIWGKSLDLSTATTMQAGWAGMAVFLTFPILFPVTSRIKASNGRCFGLVVHTAFLILLYLAIEHGSIIFGTLAVALMLTMFISSFFAMQTSVFFSVGLALWYVSPVPLLVLIAALVIAFLFPTLGARDPLVFKVNHFIWHHNNRGKNTGPSNRNLFKNVFLFFKALKNDRHHAYSLFFYRSPLIIGLYSAPVLWIVLAKLCYSNSMSAATASGFGEFCMATLIISTVFFALTGTRQLSIFGEAERYTEFSAPFTAMLFVMTPALAGGSVLEPAMAIILLQVTIIMLVNVIHNDHFIDWLINDPISGGEYEPKVLERLSELEGSITVATIPIKLPILLTAYNDWPDRIKFYYRFIQQSLKLDAFDYYDKDIVDLNVFAGTPDELAEKWGVTHILCQKERLTHGRFDFIDTLMDKHDIVFEEGPYILYSIAPLTNDGKES